MEKKPNNSPDGSAVSELRIALVGIGSELNGDDAAGLWVARELQTRLAARPQFLALEAGVMPESSAGPLRKFKPDLVILADAADFGGQAGEIRWLDSRSIQGFGASTHTFPLSVVVEYLQTEIQCDIFILGVQPDSLEFAAPLTPFVDSAVREITSEIISLLQG